METLFYLHTKMHHGLYLLSGLSVVVALVAMLRKQIISGMGLWIIRIYSIVLTLQVTVGLLQIAMRWSDLGDGLRHRLEHGTLMLVALTMVHMTPRFIRRGDSVGTRNTLLMLVGSLALILLGVSLIKRAIAGA
jgi:heme A synthase